MSTVHVSLKYLLIDHLTLKL